MSVRAEGHLAGGGGQRPFDEAWRAEVAAAQEAAVPVGRTSIACTAPYGVGGLGRHLQEIMDALDRSGQPTSCLCGPGAPRPLTRPVVELRSSSANVAQRLPPMRFSPGWRTWLGGVAFDRQAARRTPAAENVIAFNGQALAQIDAARRRGCESVAIVSANSHLEHVARQHAQAYRRYPLEPSWTSQLVARNRREYARVDRIYVATRYVWESFCEQGFDESVLRLFPFSPHPRYTPAPESEKAATFNVVYVGNLTVAKGVPLLLEAFRRLQASDLRLVLVGGWATRAMRRHIAQACEADKRITVAPGDPLPHLRAARLYVHPSYEDGFGYAPVEAMACGVPVIVTADTGMKDLLSAGDGGMEVPTGDLQALTEAVDAAYRRELVTG